MPTPTATRQTSARKSAAARPTRSRRTRRRRRAASSAGGGGGGGAATASASAVGAPTGASSTPRIGPPAGAPGCGPRYGHRGMPLDSPVTATARREAEQHIVEHALGEAERIARLSRIREFVLGAQDGLLVPLGVVTGMAAAHPARSLVIVAGLSEAVAGAISMGGGSFLASQAEEQLYSSEIAAEGREIDEFPEREAAELAVVLEREGLSRSRA